MKTSHFQFGIGRLIILTSAVAVVMAVSIRLDVPQFAQWVFAGYLAFFVGWTVMRGPDIHAKLLEARVRRRQLKQSRNELESEAAKLRHAESWLPAVNNRESALEHFRRLNAHLSHREVNGRRVLGIQLRNRDASDADLRHLDIFRDELDVIGLEGTRITDEGLKHLRGLSVLENVDLTDTAISDAGLEILAKIESLEYIHLAGTAVTAEGVARLETALPNCEVVWDGT